jgi:hypothetical protein
MRTAALGITAQIATVPARGERVAAYIDDYLKTHTGLSVSELAFRLKADKRDLRRLLQDRSCGWRLEDSLAAYFGPDFVDAVFAPVIGHGPSRREIELERERAELAARRERLERRRAEDRAFYAARPAGLRVVPQQAGREPV